MPSFEDIFGLAMHLKYIEDLKLNLKTTFNGALLTALYFESESEEKRRKDDFFDRNKEIIEKINGEIREFNSKLKDRYGFLPTKLIEEINLDKVKEIIYGHKGKDSASRENTILKLNNCLLDYEGAIKSFFDSFEIQLIPFSGRKFSEDIGKENYWFVKEAFDIYSIGYFGTAVLVMGKCLEKNITDLLEKNVNKSRIKYSLEEINKWNFDTKINILKKERLVSDSDFSKIMSIKWDRNVAGHPSSMEEMEKLRRDSSGTITLCLNQIVELQKKMKAVKSESEIEHEKSEEILGGKATWGGPILFGDAKERLKQLEGYGGQLIEDIREKLKREVEDSNQKL
jgi:hypothetical protein